MLKKYVDKFNNNDTESVKSLIDNEHCYDFLDKNAPKLLCPDKDIEETFAFRGWTFRKHIRQADGGFVVSEFLPDVSWASKYNTLNASFPFHISECRWFACADDFLYYVDFILNNKGNSYHYYTPAIPEIVSFLKTTDNMWYVKENISIFEEYFKGWEDRHLLPCGLYRSNDWFDAMEYSISGTTSDDRITWGIRPTLNSYMYQNAVVMVEIESSLGRNDKADFYNNKAQTIKKLANERLWDGDFYKAAHTRKEYYKRSNWDVIIDCNESLSLNDASYKTNVKECDVKELLGYIPWIAQLAPEGRDSAFRYLKDEKVFKATTGFATADISHERFLYARDHECQWNGYVWPFATTQTINAVISLLDNYKQNTLTNQDLYDFIKTYANMHYIYLDGKKINYIDEMMHPFKHEWTTRDYIIKHGLNERFGWVDRGKDYNHSTFLDLVIRGLCGVNPESETLTVNPKIIGIWKWFKLQIPFKKHVYDIYYDEDGTYFNKGKGITIELVK